MGEFLGNRIQFSFFFNSSILLPLLLLYVYLKIHYDPMMEFVDGMKSHRDN